MVIQYSDLIGYIGTFFLCITLIPQVYHTFKTKKVDDLSIMYISFQIISNGIYIYYGFLINALPIVICNCFVMIMSSSLCFAKYRFRTSTELYENLIV